MTLKPLALGLMIAMSQPPQGEPPASPADDRRDEVRNLAVRANVSAFRHALERFAKANRGAYPPEGDVVGRLVGGKFLMARQMPTSPWGRFSQANALRGPGGPEGLALGTVLGAGQVPTEERFTPTTYGAILYAYDPGLRTYRVAGVGKRGADAVVVAVADNRAPVPATPAPAPEEEAP